MFINAGVVYCNSRGVSSKEERTLRSSCSFMRNKTGVVECFKKCCAELAYYGYRVGNLHSDKGSEYFSEKNELVAGKDRSLGELDKFCARLSPKIKHVVTPVESKEKIAEVWFRDMFETADTLLSEARLSSGFWCDDLSYSRYFV